MQSNVYTSLKRQHISDTLLKEGVYRANTSLAAHSHEQPNLCFVLKGGCTERLGGTTVDFKPLTLGFLAAGDEHSLRMGDQPIRCFGIEPAASLVARLDECSLKLNRSIYLRSGRLIDLLAKIHHEFCLADSASPLAIEGLLLETLVEVARRQPLTIEKAIPRWLKQTEEMLRAQFRTPPELAQIAAAANVHPTHLAREFRRYFNCTIGEYVRRLRVDFARRRLLDSSVPLTMIALEAGFADQSHLTREFKRLTGLAPGQYRKLCKSR